MKNTTLLRLPEVKQQTGYARATLYSYMRRGLFPEPVKIGLLTDKLKSI